ncbi:MAG: phage tail protein [Oscillospiraceae bacterium]|nr:phage tail protein [Oscillospiraceae bacterium]
MMYFVEVENRDMKHTLHDPYSETETLYKGSVTLVLNAVSDFRFSLLPNHPRFEDGCIEPYVSRIVIRRIAEREEEVIFRGRVIDMVQKMSSDGLILKEFVTECELAYLIDSKQRAWEHHGLTPRQYLERILARHNESVLGDSTGNKEIHIGNVNITHASTVYHTTNDTSLKHIKDLVGILGGYIGISHDGTRRRLNYQREIGEIHNIPIKLAVNLKSIRSQTSSSRAITRLIPLGAERDDVSLAIARLRAANIIRSDAFERVWRDTTNPTPWLSQLLINLSRLRYGPDWTLSSADLVEALEVLVHLGVMNSPDYWAARADRHAVEMSLPWQLHHLLMIAAGHALRNEPKLDAPRTRLKLAGDEDYIDATEVSGAQRFMETTVEGTIVWDDVTNPDELRTKAEAWLRQQSVSNSVTISALDLSLIGESSDRFCVGNTYTTHHPILGIDDAYRLIEQTIDLLDPLKGTLTFGNRPVGLGGHISR